MKALFASLLCLVLGASQIFAIKGGPNYGGSGNLVGRYAGIMRGPANSLGIFTLGVPTTGTSTGIFVIFTRGLFLKGDVQAIADSNTAHVDGLLHAEATRTTTVADKTSTIIVAVADGQMMATVSKTGTSIQVSSTLLKGTAVINEHGPDDVSSDPTKDESYTVTGFKQSSAPP